MARDCGAPQWSDLRAQVRRSLADYFMTGGMPDEAALLVDDLGADSLDLLQVVDNLNDMFDVDIGVDLLPQMLTVGGACDVVQRLRQGGRTCHHDAIPGAAG
ncbi:acyl carrier protein [Xanthomonas theicola]|nr:acyl carrier protein [Xanthomonas theicola]QNH25237.1 acyl carrier protein [Xanthomonas theicola]